MNWNEIKGKYPKAFQAFYFWFYNSDNIRHVNSIDLYNDCIDYAERVLYDFFDESGIYINVDYRVFYDIHHELREYFDWEIYSKDSAHSSEVEHDSRNEAETEAFNKAFEILEEK